MSLMKYRIALKMLNSYKEHNIVVKIDVFLTWASKHTKELLKFHIQLLGRDCLSSGSIAVVFVLYNTKVPGSIPS